MPTDPRQPVNPAVRELIRRKAATLFGRAGLTRQDAADLEQELLLGLLKSLPGIATAATCPEALVWTVLYRVAANLLRARRTAKRDSHRARPLGGSGDVPVGADQRRPAGRTDAEWADLAGDVADVLAGLSPGERELAEQLMRQTKAGAARRLGKPRTILYSAIRRLRERFERAGLKDYL